MKRPTVDERMDMWLNWQADQADVPDEERQRYIDAMRGTTKAACARVCIATDGVADEVAETPLGRLLLWASGYHDRVPRWQRELNPNEGDDQ